MTLHRLSPTPLWQQMADAVRGRIASGAWAAGDRLPSEAELGQAFAVSRITVRKAIETLLAEDLVVRTHGKGTFVARPTLRHDLSDLVGIIDSLRPSDSRPQLRPSTRLLAFDHAPATPYAATRLGSGDADVLHFRRLYELDGAPFGLADVWIPGASGVTRAQTEPASAYTILSRHLGIAVTHADMLIRAHAPDRGVRQDLRLTRSASLLRLERTSRCVAGIAREHTRFWVRSDRYEFSLGVNGPIPIGAALRPAA